MTNWLDNLRRQARANPRRIMLPEIDDLRVLDAARELAEHGLGIPVFEEAPASPCPGAVVLNHEPEWQERRDHIHAEIRRLFAHDDKADLTRADHYPLMHAAVALRLGYVDAAVCGSVATTANVLRCGIKGVGVADNSELVSSSFLMDWQHRTFSFADCAVVPDPDSEQLAQIAISAAATHRRLTGEMPCVAMLSLSTHGSASHALVEKICDAVRIARHREPDLAIDGELQFDAALLPDVARRKAPESEVAGHANTFVFPNLDAANIGYKIAERMGGATATGPVLNGLHKPWLDLSRGCSASDIVNLAVIGAALSQAENQT